MANHLWYKKSSHGGILESPEISWVNKFTYWRSRTGWIAAFSKFVLGKLSDTFKESVVMMLFISGKTHLFVKHSIDSLAVISRCLKNNTLILISKKPVCSSVKCSQNNLRRKKWYEFFGSHCYQFELKSQVTCKLLCKWYTIW